MSSVTAQRFFRYFPEGTELFCRFLGAALGCGGRANFYFFSQMANEMQIGFYLSLQKIVFSYMPEA